MRKLWMSNILVFLFNFLSTYYYQFFPCTAINPNLIPHMLKYIRKSLSSLPSFYWFFPWTIPPSGLLCTEMAAPGCCTPGILDFSSPSPEITSCCVVSPIFLLCGLLLHFGGSFKYFPQIGTKEDKKILRTWIYKIIFYTDTWAGNRILS